MSVDSDVVEWLRDFTALIKKSVEFLELVYTMRKKYRAVVDLSPNTLLQLQAALGAERAFKVISGLLQFIAIYEKRQKYGDDPLRMDMSDLEDLISILKEAVRLFEEALQGV